MRFGRSFVRGFGWGLGRGAAYNLTRRRSQRLSPLTDKQMYERAHVQEWINEAITAYRLDGVSDPSFDDIRRYVKKYFHYTLTK